MSPFSFVIITYNRPVDMLALAKNIAELEGASDMLEEVIILNNASTEDYGELKNFIRHHPEIPFRYLDAPSNLGVTKGRNYAIKFATAPILIMLDDDAELEGRDSLYKLQAFFQSAKTSRPLAIVSFKVLYYENREMQVNALPHKKFDKYKDKSFFETYYFAGGAHAITKEAIEKLGLYPEDFFYGMEEYDLGYRLLDAGYSIAYSNSVVMLHKESPQGRKPKKEKLQMMWVNKCKVAWRYLPERYFWSTAFLWSFQYLAQTRFFIPGFWVGWGKVVRIPEGEKRTPVKATTIAYLKQLDARLFY